MVFKLFLTKIPNIKEGQNTYYNEGTKVPFNMPWIKVPIIMLGTKVPNITEGQKYLLICNG
jgi:hypothetical protein